MALPIANAGPNQPGVLYDELVTLFGGDSYDPDDDTITTWEWAQTHGETVSFDTTVANPTFTAPNVPTVDLRFTLRIRAGGEWSSKDAVLITVSDPGGSQPIADAGDNQTINVGDFFTLDGTGTADPDINGNPITDWKWIQTDGEEALLNDDDLALVQGVAPLVGGEMRFILQVTAGGIKSAPDAVIVLVVDPAEKPIALIDAGAGVDRHITVLPDTVVVMDGTLSVDPLDLPLAYTWQQTADVGEDVTLTTPTASISGFTAPSITTEMRFTLVVNNGIQDSDPEALIVRVEAPPILPLADADIDQTVAYSSTVTLDATGSTDPTGNGPLTTWTWEQTYGPDVTLDLTDPEKPTFPAGTTTQVYQFSLVVGNATESGNPDYVNINVTPDGLPLTKVFPTAIFNSASPTNALTRVDETPLIEEDHVHGELVRVFWTDINPAQGVFYWEYIDRVVDFAQREGKVVDLAVGDSYSAPQWLIDICSTFDYEFRDVTRTTCLPWDTNYLNYKDEFIAALGARYDNTSNIRAVYWTYSAMTNGMEGHWRVDEAEYTTAGYTPALLLAGGKAVLDSYIAAFPNTKILIEAHTVFDVVDQIEDVYDYGFAEAGNQVGLAIWWAASRIALNIGGNEIDSLIWPVVQRAISQGSPVAAQFVGNFTDQTWRYDNGEGWTPEFAIQHELAFFRAEGINLFEIWTKDLENPALIPLLNGGRTFEETRSQYTQEHFEVIEIDLPVITGACTISGANGFGTPLSCDQAWTGEYKTYKFTTENAPLLPGNIYRNVTKIRETVTELKSGSGLGSRGSLNIIFNDFIGDPNVDAPGVTDIRIGTFFGKLSARQVMSNKPVRLKLYRVADDGSINLEGGAETRYYTTESLKRTNSDTWSLSCKDVLSVANLGEKVWPPQKEGYLLFDIDDTVTAIQVDEETDYSNAEVVRIGDEHLRVNSVSNNMTSTAQLNVANRGAGIVGTVSGELLTATVKSEHDAGDEVYICEVSDDETIDALLTRILTDSDFDASLIPSTDWAAEVAEFHALDKINTVHGESEPVNEALNRILNGFLMDCWFDPVDNKAKLSAISVWKQSSSLLTEGREINAHSLKTQPKENLRASRAFIAYDKRNLSDSNDITSFKKASQFADNTIVSEALYKEHKDKVFPRNHLVDSNAAQLLTQRYVSRFKKTPFTYTWEAQERFLTYKTGDVVDIASINTQGFDGSASGDLRAQITKINPVYGKGGRTYKVSAINYEVALETGTEIVLDSPLNSVNLYVLAGAPPGDVELTFVLDGSYSYGSTAIRAGGFTSGSKIILILANGFDGQANSGAGGMGGGLLFEPEFTTWLDSSSAQDGGDGGVVYNAEGIDTDIYFSGATTSTAYPTADGYIRAPGGGGGGSPSNSVGTTDAIGYSGHGGGSGAGRNAGAAGAGGSVESYDPTKTGVVGETGQQGDTAGNGGIGGSTGINLDAGDAGDWGEDGAGVVGGGDGGSKGSGIIDNGGTVTLFGSDASRYINGNGDH